MEKITDIHGQLLEGCIWDEQKNRLYFVDIEGFRIYKYETESQKLSFFQMDTFVGCIVLNKEGNLVAALQDGLYEVNSETGSACKLMESGLTGYLRYNDGKCDKWGDLWVGSMAADQNHEKAVGGGSLYCISDNRVVKEYSGYTIPNGLDWDEKKSVFYHTDTYKKQISVYESGIRGERGKKVGEIDLSKEKGAPDGMCIDCNGNLWIALWGGSEVICLNPVNGIVQERIAVPDKNVSCCVFGGKEKNCLFITTARDEEGNGGEVYSCMTDICGKKAERYEYKK